MRSRMWISCIYLHFLDFFLLLKSSPPATPTLCIFILMNINITLLYFFSEHSYNSYSLFILHRHISYIIKELTSRSRSLFVTNMAKAIMYMYIYQKIFFSFISDRKCTINMDICNGFLVAYETEIHKTCFQTGKRFLLF